MQKFPLALLLATLLALSQAYGRDPFATLVTYEAKQRTAAGVGDSQYRLLPFRLTGQAQHFLQAPKTNESISAEVVVHWMNDNSSLRFPSFDLTQKVRLVIEEDTLSATLPKPILNKEFLTQTGFKITLTAGRKYRWRIQSSGKQPKLVEIAVVTKSQNQITQTATVVKKHSEEVQLLRKMAQTLQIVKQMRAREVSKQSKSAISEIWAWMSGMEMISLLAILMVQLTLFEKFMMPTSVV